MFVVYCFSSINVFIRVVSEVWSNIKQTAYKPKFPCLRRSVGVPGSHLPGVMISILQIKIKSILSLHIMYTI